MMLLHTKHFGEIEINEERIIDFPEGILGFEDEKQFVIINNEDEENPFQWLQSVANPDLAFVIINPFFVYPNYEIVIPETAQEKLKLKDEKDVAVYSIVVVPEDIEKMTANLLGPIIINTKEKLGKQVVLDDDRYTTKHFVFRQNKENRGE
ncbi:flagellar assembly protein FliW [Tepidimicrobium xylanilyticum]|uniref:Flagellar assembly factor FliW n=2 Tax=Tepidimicrobium xylanilyticum TaxID=1123352 RepID=A0A1H2QUH6_9FIRM|nr:flagellar assembly protein FliW [Tepidimicrobium xylanilyticum]GMG95581.1 flagellar assembly factor FliW [Tepidimicrobium xylanilyticum]SDW10568.1 flagellar assembly factor FliW [Tepidimicrobium xylanilyticum]